MSQATFSNGYALLIGVGGPRIEITVKDATALYDLLKDTSRAAYPKNQIQLLTRGDADRKGILQAFDTLIERVNNNPDATVIVYFSGHGIQVEHEDKSIEYFLIPHGYVPDHPNDTAISGAEFTAKIAAIDARKLVVLLDCCHAGGMPTYKAPGAGDIKSINLPPNLLEILDKGSGRVIFASSRENEKSYVVDGMPYSVFTTCLVEALDGKAAVEKDGFARILDIVRYLINQVPQRVSLPQHPLVSRIHNLDENFPICYYSGGSKELPGAAPVPEPPSTPPQLKPIRKYWLEARRDILRDEWNIRVEKLKRLHKRLAYETDTSTRLKLEMETQEEEEILTRLETEFEEINRKLQ